MGQVISPGASALLALKDLSVISTSAAFRLRKILNNDLPPVTFTPRAIVRSNQPGERRPVLSFQDA